MKNVLRTVPVVVILGVSLCWSASRGRRYLLEDVDVYGSSAVTAQQIKDSLTEPIAQFLRQHAIRTKAGQAKADGYRKDVEEGVRKLGDFGWVHVDALELGGNEKGDIRTLLIFDVIEKKAMAVRFPFRPAPKGAVKDSAGLIEAYKRYALVSSEVVRSGSGMDRADCPAFHCPPGAGNAETNALEERFGSDVDIYKSILEKILSEDRDPEKREAALYVLSYLKDGVEVVRLASFAMTDPGQRVREAALLVLNDIAIRHKEVLLPVQDIIRVMDYPYPADRNRALAVMLSLTDNPDYESVLLGPASTQMLKLLRCKNPSNRQMAHTVLRLFSGENYAADDPDQWENWLWKTRQEKAKGK